MNQPKTPTNPKGSGRPPSDKKMFSYRVEKKHTCTNEKSKRHAEVITLNDFVCDVWEL